MQSLTAIPSDDIISFLQANNIPSSSNISQNYLTAWDLLRSNAYQSAPSSIADWIIAERPQMDDGVKTLEVVRLQVSKIFTHPRHVGLVRHQPARLEITGVQAHHVITRSN